MTTLVSPPQDPTASTPNSTPRSIALITCSTRPIRAGPSVSNFVHDTLLPLLPQNTTLTLLDLSQEPCNLPLLNEPGVAAHLPAADPTPHYAHAHTRAWSSEVRKHEAFIFVTPQYNWSFPAGLKNALDYLYHEWAGKAAMVVSYGGRGGGLGAAQLRQVLKALHMRVVETSTGLKVKVPRAPSQWEVEEAAKSWPETWVEDGAKVELEKGFRELFALLDAVGVDGAGS